MDSSLKGGFGLSHVANIMASFAFLTAAYFLVWTIYDVYFGTLSKFPGPKSRAVSVLPAILTMVGGNDNTDHLALHAKYGEVVRTGPRTLSYANGSVGFKDIYGFGKKGLTKDKTFYGKPVNRVPSLITADDATHSRQRKILSNAFSDRALKDQEPLFKQWVELMKTKLQERAESGEKVDMLKFYNCTTFDIMGDLTFGEGLNMLRDSEYSPWVKTIFESIKLATFFRGFKSYSWVNNWLVENVVFKSDLARKKIVEHWNFSKERVDKRLAQENSRPDLWTKILEKSEGTKGLSLGEHHSIAALFVSIGTTGRTCSMLT
jgi:hypothetical protein